MGSLEIPHRLEDIDRFWGVRDSLLGSLASVNMLTMSTSQANLTYLMGFSPTSCVVITGNEDFNARRTKEVVYRVKKTFIRRNGQLRRMGGDVLVAGDLVWVYEVRRIFFMEETLWGRKVRTNRCSLLVGKHFLMTCQCWRVIRCIVISQIMLKQGGGILKQLRKHGCIRRRHGVGRCYEWSL